MKKYILTKDDIQQEFLTFAHFMQEIEEDWYNGKINGGQYAKRVGLLAKEYAGRDSSLRGAMENSAVVQGRT
jgi:hypothetical protein